MNALKKGMAVVFLSVAALFSSTPCAKATITGDAAILAQQILQYLNDIEMDLQQWDYIEEKVDKVAHISRIIDATSKAYTSVNSISKTIETAASFVSHSKMYYNYLATCGSNFRVLNCGRMINSFWDSTVMMEQEVVGTLNTFSNLLSSVASSPKEQADVADKVGDQFKIAVLDRMNASQMALDQYIHQTALDNAAKSNQNFLKLRIH